MVSGIQKNKYFNTMYRKRKVNLNSLNRSCWLLWLILPHKKNGIFLDGGIITLNVCIALQIALPDKGCINKNYAKTNSRKWKNIVLGIHHDAVKCIFSPYLVYLFFKKKLDFVSHNMAINLDK